MPCYLQPVAHSAKIHSLNNIIPRLSMDINTGGGSFRKMEAAEARCAEIFFVDCVMMLSL
jgi:hypothetical protein